MPQGCDKHESETRCVQLLNILQTYNRPLAWSKSLKKENGRKDGGENDREVLQPVTWQMACHACSSQLRYRAIQQISRCG